MKSPRWRTPVVSYIEEYCLVFDNEDENKLEYTSIHKVSESNNNLTSFVPVAAT